MMDTDVGTTKKDDAAEVVKNGFDAMMKGEGDVISGLKEWADFLGALLGKWTANLSPASLAIVPWAILTSALQGFILVPLFPFGSPSSRCSSPTGSASWFILRRHPCSPGFVARLPNERRPRADHFSGFGALSDFRNSACGRRP